jgi:hypothetical protein
MSNKQSTIKVCGDPQCDAVYHNCPVKITRCPDCNGRIMKINNETYNKKFANYWFQYDFVTMSYFHPLQSQLILDF